jgi:hypothetical protein
VDKILKVYMERSVCFVLDNSTGELRMTYHVAEDALNKMMKFGNGIYLHIMDSHYYTNLKEYCWKKNISFSQITSTEYKIYSQDKIKLVLNKLVDDVITGKNDKFVIIKFVNLMR